MKKVISIVLVLVLCFGLVSCASNNDNTPATPEPSLSDVEVAAQTVLTALRNTLKNPDSFQVHSVNYVDTYTGNPEYATVFPTSFTYVFQIDYSAQNGFGGMNRKTMYVLYNNENDFKQDVENIVFVYGMSEPQSSINISKLNY